MKKFFIMAAACAGLLMTACSKEEAPGNPGTLDEGKTHEVEIAFDLNVNAGLDTRAGRELISQEGLQNVTKMTVYIFKKNAENNYIYEKSVDVPGFTSSTTTGSEKHQVLLKERLSEGTYGFLAVGTDAGRGAYETLAPVAGTTKRSEMVLKLKENHAAEVFTGIEDDGSDVTVSEDSKKLTVNITVKRLVAGVLGYFTNVPYQLPDPTDNDKMVTVNVIALELVAKGTEAKIMAREKSAQSRENVTSGDYYQLFTINLSSSGGHANTEQNIWARAAKNESGQTIRTNSFLKGGFVLPFNGIAENATMRVVLYGGSENKLALKTYKVQCSGTGTGSVTHTSNTTFNVLSNNLYSLGIKAKNVSTDGTDPTPDPDPDDETNDKPIDLSKEDIITVTVNPAWDVIHNMELAD